MSQKGVKLQNSASTFPAEEKIKIFVNHLLPLTLRNTIRALCTQAIILRTSKDTATIERNK